MARSRSRVDLEGVDDLELALRRMTEDVQGVALREAVAAGAEIPRDLASQLAPRSQDGSRGNPPGHLSRNIVAEGQWTRTQDRAEVHVGPTKDAWYGVLQERGTSYHPAQPFLRPALDTTKDDVVDEIRDHLRTSILRRVRG